MRPSKLVAGAGTDLVLDDPPLPLRRAFGAVSRSILTTVGLGRRRQISRPTDRVGTVMHFGDGSAARVYRETVTSCALVDHPAVLLVIFRLRGIRGRGHALFRAESVLNTPLFVGFPGYVSKLWLADDGDGRYRGVYQWNGAGLAVWYARSLWWLLAIVCVPDSIHYVVIPDLRRDELLDEPEVLRSRFPDRCDAWWWLTAVDPPNVLP